MDADAKTESADKRLNNLIAVTVVNLSVLMAVGNIKDGNIGQAMQKAKTESVDAWLEYQAARIKLHVDEAGAAASAGDRRQRRPGPGRQAGHRVRS